jgi:LacI family transcriptional regulator
MYTRRLAVPKLFKSRPAVLLNAVPTRPAPLISVIPDELAAGRTAAETLIKAGYRDGIYLIGAGPKRNQGPKPAGGLAAVERLEGIKGALRDAGLKPAGAVACVEWQPELGYAAVRELIEHGAKLEALICFNDRLALGAYNAVADAGLAVPSDVSVVSFDDDPIASWVQPKLTTIAIPHYELGRKSIELLLDGRTGAGQRVFRIPMPLRLRESVKEH